MEPPKERKFSDVMPTAAELNQKFESVEEFRNARHGFAFAIAKQDGKAQSPGGRVVMQVTKGVEYCFPSGALNGASTVFAPSDRLFNDVYNKYDGSDLSGKVLSVWRSGGIGDLLFMRPLLVHLKKKYPTCRIILATRSQYHSFLEYWTDAIDGLADYPFPVKEVIDNADYHLTFEGLIEKCAKANVIDVYDLFARSAGVDPKEVDVCVPMKVQTQNKIFSMLDNYAVLQINASSPVRTPNLGVYVNAANHLIHYGLKVIISDSPGRRRSVDSFISCLEHPENAINFCDYTTGIHDAIKLVDGARLVIAPDSSHIHFAGMQGVPVIGLYGPFPASVRTSHYRNCHIVENSDSDCCKYGGNQCFLHNSGGCEWAEACWKNLDESKVISDIDIILGGI